jgi:hypothetical protein
MYWRAEVSARPTVTFASASRTSSTVAARSPIGNSARKRRAVMTRKTTEYRTGGSPPSGRDLLRVEAPIQSV